MRIPLDYFSVLGIPFQVSEDQISQAYQDRLVQLPRREFGEAAIAARNRLLRSAYEVLADEQQRQEYQQRWWPTPGSEPTETSSELLSLNESGQPSLEVVPADLIGALLILQDLGEYELVLTFAEAEIYHPEDPGAIAATRSDLILMTALAYLEISREQWQRSDYEGAAHAGLKGLARLQQEDLFANVQEEIRDEIYRLRPYRILELLTPNSESDSTISTLADGERLKAIELLNDMIQDRFGIEGRGNDRSGLGIDDFLQFIQQLRPYLTVDEQEALFLAEAERPSVIASFLAVYALMAKAIAAKQPQKLEECKMLLAKLKNRQEVALEEAICALLLGQTDEALVALTDCHDEKAISLIHEQSADKSDLIPGLYSYTEQWLENEIFPCFWDLHPDRQLVSLEDYFADIGVQNYLEKITPSPPFNAVSPIDRENTMALKLTEYLEPIPRPPKRRNRLGERSSANKKSVQSTLLANPLIEEPSASVVWSSTAEPFRNGNAGQFASTNFSTPGNTHENNPTHPKRRKRRRVKINPLRFGLFLLTCFSFLGLLVFMGQSNRSPLNALELDQLDLPLAQAAIELPATNAVLLPTAPTGELDKAAAQQLVEYWLSQKALAFGPDHAIDSLDSVLAPPMLNQWQNLSSLEKGKNSYRKYQHHVEVLDVKVDGDKNQGQILAKVKEQTSYFNASNPDKPQSVNSDEITVRYQVIRQGDRWLIRRSAVQ